MTFLARNERETGGIQISRDDKDRPNTEKMSMREDIKIRELLTIRADVNNSRIISAVEFVYHFLSPACSTLEPLLTPGHFQSTKLTWTVSICFEHI